MLMRENQFFAHALQHHKKKEYREYLTIQISHIGLLFLGQNEIVKSFCIMIPTTLVYQSLNFSTANSKAIQYLMAHCRTLIIALTSFVIVNKKIG